MMLFAMIGYSQTCTPTFTTTTHSINNNLLYLAVTPNVTSTTHDVKNQVHWGDGSQSTSYNQGWSITHNYASAGTYSVMLVRTVYDSVNNIIYCVDSVSNNVTVNYSSACATSINTSISTNNDGKVTFTANTATGASNMTYTWDFQDNTPTATGSTVTHTYATGTQAVLLTASNGTCTYSNYVSFQITNNCGIANISHTSSGLLTTFYNQSTNHVGRTELATWYFGDGASTTTSALSVNHFYSNPGTYNVKLVNEWYDSATNTLVCIDSTTRSITVSGTSVINGHIYKDSTKAPFSPTYKVWLIKYDSTTQTLTAVDSTIVTNTNNYSSIYYAFNGVAYGNYRTKAAIQNNATSGTGYIPTYHDSEKMWNNAKVINHFYQSSTYVVSYAPIYMKMGTLTTGPGFVGGNVTQGANKGTANGIPDMPVYIVDMNDQLLSYSITDGAGSYSFSNIPTGTYKIYPEELGYTTTPATVTVTNTNNTFSNIYFERSHTNKTITPIPASIKNVNSISGLVALYPNPASKTVSIKWDGNESANITISDVTGKQIITDNTSANSIKRLDISKLSNGLYFVTIESKGQKLTQKLLIQ